MKKATIRTAGAVALGVTLAAGAAGPATAAGGHVGHLGPFPGGPVTPARVAEAVHVAHVTHAVHAAHAAQARRPVRIGRGNLVEPGLPRGRASFRRGAVSAGGVQGTVRALGTAVEGVSKTVGHSLSTR
jgi:hypothetical protein